MQRRNRPYLLIILLLLHVVPQAKAQTLHDIPNAVVYSDMGIPAPNTVFYAQDGSEVTLQDFKGAPLIVNFWATWCPPCVEEMPSLIALEKVLQPINGAKLITVSQDFGGMPAVERFIKKRKLELLDPYVDKKNALMNAFGIRGSLPTTILVDKNGIIIARITGLFDGNSSKIQAILKHAF